MFSGYLPQSSFSLVNPHHSCHLRVVLLLLLFFSQTWSLETKKLISLLLNVKEEETSTSPIGTPQAPPCARQTSRQGPQSPPPTRASEGTSFLPLELLALTHIVYKQTLSARRHSRFPNHGLPMGRDPQREQRYSGAHSG